MLDRLLSAKILSILPEEKDLQEIRLRENQKISCLVFGKYITVDYVVKQEDIEYIIKSSTNNSLYSCEDTIKFGYIPYQGFRIGLAGEGVVGNSGLITIKNVKSLCIRIPHIISNIDKKIETLISDFDNTIIISRPGLGKTTLLREIITRLSKDNNILVLDEKGEISFDNTIDLGQNSDVILSIPKQDAYKAFIRVLRPDIIATDEVFGSSEIDAIEDVIRCGVKVVATLHALDISTINQKQYAKLISYMRYIVIIEEIGKIKTVYDRGKK